MQIVVYFVRLSNKISMFLPSISLCGTW